MNVQSIWSGEEYAWSDNRPKGVFPRNGKKVVALKTRKVQLPGNSRKSAQVLIRYPGYNEQEVERWVPAREIVDFWDNYESELEHTIEEERRRREQREREYEQQRTEREARRKAEAEAKEQAFIDYADRLGVSRESLVAYNELTVTIHRSELERRLGLFGTGTNEGGNASY